MRKKTPRNHPPSSFSKWGALLLLVVICCGYFSVPLLSQDRFPRPEFDSQYKLPLTTTPAPRAEFLVILDIVLLVAALLLAGYLVLKKRSRRGVSGLAIFSLVYFGFIRAGCVCSVGSLQNVALALADPVYFIPVSVILFFALPLVFTLFQGRTFCAAVCPLGAIQDLLVLKPFKVPQRLAHVLEILPYIYLGLAVLLAATGSAFIICRYDPFVGFFRFSAGFEMLLLGGCFLLGSIFIARPYCRFLCPYGVLLGWMSRLARKRASITPDTCIQCRLCEEACPTGAIRKPTPGKLPEPRAKGIRRLAVLLILLPLIAAAGGWVTAQMSGLLSQIHTKVALAEQVKKENAGKTRETTLESRTFRTSGIPPAELFEEALKIKEKFYLAGWLLGIFLGLVFSVKLLSLSTHRSRDDYETDAHQCVSCARCFSYCPREHVRLDDINKLKGS